MSESRMERWKPFLRFVTAIVYGLLGLVLSAAVSVKVQADESSFMIINLGKLVEFVVGSVQIVLFAIAVCLHGRAWVLIVQNHEWARKNESPMTSVWIFGGLEGALCLASTFVIMAGRL